MHLPMLRRHGGVSARLETVTGNWGQICSAGWNVDRRDSGLSVVAGMEAAGRELGEHDGPLSSAVVESLDRDGFAVFPSLLDDATIRALRLRIEELEREEDAWGIGTNTDDPGAVRVENLNHKGSVFDGLWVHPILLAVLRLLLVDFRLGSMTSRSPRPHMGHQQLHRDGPRIFGDTPTSCQSVWMLDDFNAIRGTTRLIPGSQRVQARPEDELDDPWAAHPSEVLIDAPRGSLTVFNGYLWHSGTENTTDVPRHGIFSFYVRRDQPRKWDQAALLDESTRSRLSPEAWYVLDV